MKRDSYFALILDHGYCFKKDLAECGLLKNYTTALDVVKGIELQLKRN
jgi:hypothetical protein